SSRKARQQGVNWDEAPWSPTAPRPLRAAIPGYPPGREDGSEVLLRRGAWEREMAPCRRAGGRHNSLPALMLHGAVGGAPSTSIGGGGFHDGTGTRHSQRICRRGGQSKDRRAAVCR